ncbi:cutinase family protein [Pseudarthrobacter sp. C4D7]|uniref:cutinase family protein n=1 Tax=Pseudarthrobacter sp. C4D7 TaxID=2735268 RepID=UPI001585B2F2|nr:cutinase family protein [Pseudarthrobacter sp. C4D7]NUT70926.1 cutinase family protein [Pseudarthrobacter sp. C4D7]
MKARYHFFLAKTALVAALAASSLIVAPAAANADATIVSDLVNEPGFVSPNSRCDADVAVIGARGSAQPLIESHEGKPVQEGSRPQDHIAGFGNEVATAAYEITRRLPAATNLRFIPVNYPAVSAINGFIEADNIGANFKFGKSVLPSYGDHRTYMASVNEGAASIVDTVRKLSTTCPGTEIVLIGFSQGAHTTHIALDMLRQENLLANIAAVQLIADPMRNPLDQTPFNYSGKGTLGSWTFSKIARPIPDSTWDTGAPSGIREGTDLTNGVGSLWIGTPQNPQKYVPIPVELKGKVVNVCHMLDMVCNLSPVFDFDAHGSVYTDTYEYRHWQGNRRINNSDIYTAPGQWMTNRLNIAHRVGGTGGLTVGPECADLTIIGTRGEDWLEATDVASHEPEIPGFGPSVSAAARKLKEQLPAGTSVAFASVHPPLPPRDPKAPLHGIMGPPNMFDLQVIAGVKKATELAAKTVEDCPDTKLVILGYSQGAQILHETVSAANESVLSRIAAVWLMGDTARDPSLIGSTAGAGESLPADDNGGQYVADAKARNAVAISQDLSDRYRSVCMIADKGCRSLTGSYNGATNRQTQRGIYLDSATLDQGAQWASKRIVSLPLSTGAQVAKIRRGVSTAWEAHKTTNVGGALRPPLLK